MLQYIKWLDHSLSAVFSALLHLDTAREEENKKKKLLMVPFKENIFQGSNEYNLFCCGYWLLKENQQNQNQKIDYRVLKRVQ